MERIGDAVRQELRRFGSAGVMADVVEAALGKAAPKRLRFAPGPLPEPAVEASTAAAEPLPEATLEQAREAHAWAAEIDSEELRKTVEKAARASLARAGSGRSI